MKGTLENGRHSLQQPNVLHYEILIIVDGERLDNRLIHHKQRTRQGISNIRANIKSYKVNCYKLQMLIYDEFVLCTRMSGLFDCSTMENASLTQFFCVFLGHHKIF